MDLAPDFNAFIECLSEHRVEFVIVGAYALAIHGVPRFTGDIAALSRPDSPDESGHENNPANG